MLDGRMSIEDVWAGLSVPAFCANQATPYPGTMDMVLWKRILESWNHGGRNTIYEILAEGSLRISVPEFFEAMKKVDSTLYLVVQHAGETWDRHINAKFLSKCGYVSLSGTPKKLDFAAAFTDEKIALGIRKLIEQRVDPPQKLGAVYAVVRSEKDLKLAQLGIAKVNLERQNYEPVTVEGYDKIVRELKSSVPKGRLAILVGPPGSGKTFLLRGLLSEVAPATFILVPPSMVKDVSGPDVLPLLISKTDHSETSGPPGADR